MDDKIAIITGASDGIGAEAARQLRAKGASVVIVGRSPEKARAVAREIGAKHYSADFAKLSDVRKLAADLRRDYRRIDVLANNAGGLFGKREITVDGHEKTMQVNHLAPFLLTNLLLDVLIASKAAVINTASVAHKLFSRFDINDLEVARNYTARVAYANSKLENILFTRELHRRYHDQGISTACFHPGIVASNFASTTDDWMRFVYRTPLRRLMLISPAKGADTLVWLASTMPGKDWKSGEYYYKRRISHDILPAATNPDYARSLWEQSEAFIAK
jgi:NAD(P)-dependent dehydrogenase (short-subunit alcohol dehydrogenase family)